MTYSTKQAQEALGTMPPLERSKWISTKEFIDAVFQWYCENHDDLTSLLTKAAEDWIMVPREPTRKIIQACWHAQYKFNGADDAESETLSYNSTEKNWEQSVDAYKAMIRASEAQSEE